jgi:cathepsin L
MTGKPPLVLSEQELVDCMPNPDQCGGTGGCEGGTQWLGFDYYAKYGITLEC